MIVQKKACTMTSAKVSTIYPCPTAADHIENIVSIISCRR